MLLTVDVGNTNTVLGLFEGDRLVTEWRIATTRGRTADELDVQLAGLLARRGFDERRGRRGLPVDRPCRRWRRRGRARWSVPSGRRRWWSVPGIRTGMPVRTDNPREVGPDRVVNAVAAYALVGGPCVVVDFGTSTNFDVVSADGAFLGGVIAPGIEVSMDALFARAARLGAVELVAPPTVIGRSTIACIQSGAVYGFAGPGGRHHAPHLRRARRPRARPSRRAASRRWCTPHAETIDRHEPGLTLDGLRLIWERNREGTPAAAGASEAP